ncbi:MAG: CPBP family intramembrane metalloprotease [Candidatus Omnitrophica bacterium]|nr:CPBP family intramembrane metalloprotease [Candidatus Omnitrophota bacterium]
MSRFPGRGNDIGDTAGDRAAGRFPQDPEIEHRRINSMRIFHIIRKNRLYVFLLFFIISINALAYFGKRPVERATESRVSAGSGETEKDRKGDTGTSRTLFNEAEAAAREKKLLELAETDPLMYFFAGIFNLSILFLVFAGFLFDIYLGARFFRKEQVAPRLGIPPAPAWGIGDVGKAALIFLTSGYIFAIFQELFIKVLPIMGNDNFRMVAGTAAMNLVAISVILYFIVKKRGQEVEASGLNRRGGVLRGIFYGAAGYIALLPVLIVIMLTTYFVSRALKYEPPVQPIVEVFLEEKQTSVLMVSTLFAAVFGPVAEEIFFRGFMYPAIKKRFGIIWSMFLTAAIFSLLHTHIVGFLPILALGLLLAYLYERTGSLVAPITVHVIHNVGMVMLVFLMRYIGAL